jgi:hypothetical protein
VLHLDISAGVGPNAGQIVLPPGALPRLRELRSGRDFAAALLHCPVDGARPLEILKGVKLSGTGWDDRFLAGLRRVSTTVKRIELAGWNEVEDIKRLVVCAPKLAWLDVGKRANANATTSSGPSNLVSAMSSLSFHKAESLLP